MQEPFKMMDTNEDGEVTEEELKTILRNIG